MSDQKEKKLQLDFPPLFYNAGQLEPDQIEAQFIARQDVFKNIMEDIVGERNDAAPQHHLIIGQRGMGKTTLLHRLAVELNKEPHCERFIPLTFQEEQHVLVEQFSDFWLNVLDSFATAVETRGDRKLARELDDQIKQLEHDHPDEKDLADAALRYWMEQWQALGWRPVLMLDNFPLLLEKLKDYDWDLRTVLQAAGAPIFVAAGVAMPEELGRYDAAFFDTFKSRLLYSLTLDECREIYTTLAKREGNKNVVRLMAQHEGRLRTLHVLTGGTPRTVGLLYELFARGLGDSAWEDLRALLDKMTPLYQSRLEQLTEKSQQVFAALALHWRPALQRDIGRQTKLNQGTLSSTLQRMADSGVVEKVEIAGQKKTGWQIAERFFNIWFLMRFASRRTQGTIGALASFLEVFYSRDELRDLASGLMRKIKDAEGACFALAASAALGDSAIGRDLRNRAQETILRMREGLGGSNLVYDVDIPIDVKDFFTVRDKWLPRLVPEDADVKPEEFARMVVSSPMMIGSLHQFKDLPDNGKIKDLSSRIEELNGFRLQLVTEYGEEAVKQVEERLYDGLLTSRDDRNQWKDALQLAGDPKTIQLWVALIPIEMADLKLAGSERLVESCPDDPSMWVKLGGAIMMQTSNQAGSEAESAFRKSLEIDDSNSQAWQGLGVALRMQAGKAEQSMDAFRKAVEIEPQNATALVLLSQEYLETGRPERAEDLARRAIELGPSATTFAGLAEILLRDRSRHEEAISILEKVIQLDPHAWQMRIRLGVLLEEYRQHDRAEKVLKEGTELDANKPFLWRLLGRVYRNQGLYAEAKTALATAAELGAGEAWNELAVLFSDYLDDIEQALACFKKAGENDRVRDVAALTSMPFLRWAGNIEDARGLLEKVGDVSGLAQLKVILNQSAFDLFARNIGDATDRLRKAMGFETDWVFGPDTIDDWYGAAAEWLELGHGEEWLAVWKETGAASERMPFHEAVRAHQLGGERFLNNIPKEAQHAAREIYQDIDRRRERLRKLKAEATNEDS